MDIIPSPLTVCYYHKLTQQRINLVNLMVTDIFIVDLQYKITTDTNFGRNFVFKKAKETVSSSTV